MNSNWFKILITLFLSILPGFEEINSYKLNRKSIIETLSIILRVFEDEKSR